MHRKILAEGVGVGVPLGCQDPRLETASSRFDSPRSRAVLGLGPGLELIQNQLKSIGG